MSPAISACIIKNSSNLSRFLKTLKSLQDNLDYIDQIIYTGSAKEIPSDIDLAITSLGLDSANKAFLRNACLENATSDYILWVSVATELEDTTLEEYLDILKEEGDADLIYPNEVIAGPNGDESIKNYQDFKGKNEDLIRSMAIEDHLPEWGVLTKREIFGRLGKFDENFADYEFYNFLYRNIGKISLKNSDLSFVTNTVMESFIDTSYRSKALRDTLDRQEIKPIFPNLKWNENENVALATAYTMIGDRLAAYFDYYNAADYYRQALLAFHNQHTLKKLIETYYAMGLWDEASKLLDPSQGLSQAEIDTWRSLIEKTTRLIAELESLVKEGKIAEVLGFANDLHAFYGGAPFYNILGIIAYLQKQTETAYRFFYKSVTMNPLDRDVLQNLIDLSLQIGKKEEVAELINRLTK